MKNQKISPEVISKILFEFQNTRLSGAEVAQKYGVSRSTIYYYKNKTPTTQKGGNIAVTLVPKGGNSPIPNIINKDTYLERRKNKKNLNK